MHFLYTLAFLIFSALHLASASYTPTCDGSFYATKAVELQLLPLSIGTSLYKLSFQDPTFQHAQVACNLSLLSLTVAQNPVDGLIYTIEQVTGLVRRINPDCSTTVVANLGLVSVVLAADFDARGRLWMLTQASVALSIPPITVLSFEYLNVTTGQLVTPPTQNILCNVGTISDIAYNPADGLFYSVDTLGFIVVYNLTRTQASCTAKTFDFSGCPAYNLVSFLNLPLSVAVNPSVWFDAYGNMYMYAPLSSLTDTPVAQVNVLNGTCQYVGQNDYPFSLTVNTNAATCSPKMDFQKSTSTKEALYGGNVTYTLSMNTANYNGPLTNLIIQDDLPSPMTWIAASLKVTGGNVTLHYVNNYAGNQTIIIKFDASYSTQNVSFTITAQAPTAQTGNLTLSNQAKLISSTVVLNSDDPSTVAVRDATAMTFFSAATLFVWGSNGTLAFVPIVNGSVTPKSNDGTLFPLTPVGSSSSTKTEICNTGGVPLVISSITSSDGNFSVTPGSLVVPPYTCTNITVSFVPTTADQHSAVITINSNAGLFTFAVSGLPLFLTIELLGDSHMYETMHFVVHTSSVDPQIRIQIVAVSVPSVNEVMRDYGLLSLAARDANGISSSNFEFIAHHVYPVAHFIRVQTLGTNNLAAVSNQFLVKLKTSKIG